MQINSHSTGVKRKEAYNAKFPLMVCFPSHIKPHSLIFLADVAFFFGCTEALYNIM